MSLSQVSVSRTGKGEKLENSLISKEEGRGGQTLEGKEPPCCEHHRAAGKKGCPWPGALPQGGTVRDLTLEAGAVRLTQRQHWPGLLYVAVTHFPTTDGTRHSGAEATWGKWQGSLA